MTRHVPEVYFAHERACPEIFPQRAARRKNINSMTFGDDNNANTCVRLPYDFPAIPLISINYFLIATGAFPLIFASPWAGTHPWSPLLRRMR